MTTNFGGGGLSGHLRQGMPPMAAERYPRTMRVVVIVILIAAAIARAPDDALARAEHGSATVTALRPAFAARDPRARAWPWSGPAPPPPPTGGPRAGPTSSRPPWLQDPLARSFRPSTPMSRAEA